ncbi:MAG: hypothetical protein R3285_10530, partial [Kiloniellales bacterium]|nr:hypothetical protein [Kiloniellales bacterium]
MPRTLGDGLSAWPDWSRAALAQDADAGPPDLRRLIGPRPYRPEGPVSGRLSEVDLARAVDVIADLENFFATLSRSDPDAPADPVRRQSQAAYGAAATTLDTALRNGLFRIVVTEDGKFAMVRRGDEVWVDSDLAGAWNMERVRRARQEGDDWPDIAALAALLFDHWRIRNAAGTAWLNLQLDGLAVSRAELERGGPAAGAVFTRYGFLKDIYLQAVLLATVTAGSENATLWDERAASIRQDIDTLLRSLATTSLGGRLPADLRDDWADYKAEVEQISAELGDLVLATGERDPEPSRIGTGPQKPEQEPRPHSGSAAVAEEAVPERTAAAAETGPADEIGAPQRRAASAQARDRDYIASLLARTADAVRAAEDARQQADALARQADAANLAAEEARIALAAAQSEAEGGAGETARPRQEAENLAARLAAVEDRASIAEAALAEAETARKTAETRAAELEAQLAAAQAEAAGGAEETARLRREAADLAARLEQADSEQAALAAELAEAETARESAESQVAELQTQLAKAQSEAAGGAEEAARLRREAAD